MGKRSKTMLAELKNAFSAPTLKQKEAYGRFCHTLSATALVGAVTVLHLDIEPTWYITKRFIALVLSAVVLFVVGAMLSKGE
jgi:hypothetical protein